MSRRNLSFQCNALFFQCNALFAKGRTLFSRFSAPAFFRHTMALALISLLYGCEKDESEHIYPAGVTYAYYTLEIAEQQAELTDARFYVSGKRQKLALKRHSFSDGVWQIGGEDAEQARNHQLSQDNLEHIRALNQQSQQSQQQNPNGANAFNYRNGAEFFITTSTPSLNSVDSSITTLALPHITFPQDGDTFSAGDEISLNWQADADLQFEYVKVDHCIPSKDRYDSDDANTSLTPYSFTFTLQVENPETCFSDIEIQLVMSHSAQVSDQFAGGKITARLLSPVITLEYN